MNDTVLSQADADRLLQMDKYPSSTDSFLFPTLGGALEFGFTSKDNRDKFVLNYTQARLNLSKRNHHLRGARNIGLARLDLDGPPHKNPDDTIISPNHLHLYREGYGLKWAFDIPSQGFQNLTDAYQTLLDFMVYCKVVALPQIDRQLTGSAYDD